MPLASTVLLVRPAAFGYNAETAASNHFQHAPEVAEAAVLQQALAEFDAAVTQLRAAGLRVLVFDDTAQPPKPDAIFPNNWLSLHTDGRAVLYPMCAPNRRAERRPDILESLRQHFALKEILDLAPHEQQGRYLEGTGSIVFDHSHRLAYAAHSPRTDADLLADLCRRLGYRPVLFHAHDAHGRAIYHTNVMMCLGPGFAVLCADSITDAAERAAVLQTLTETGHELVLISQAQVTRFAGNMLALQPVDGRPVLVLSESAFGVLTDAQRHTLTRHADLLPLAIPTIEAIGGGSARCMLAEVFLPAR